MVCAVGAVSPAARGVGGGGGAECCSDLRTASERHFLTLELGSYILSILRALISQSICGSYPKRRSPPSANDGCALGCL